MLASNVGAAKFVVMGRSRVVSANGTSIQKPAGIRSLRNA